jgi:hypothetical protein
MLSVVILHVIMLNVVAPVGYPRLLKIFGNVDFKLKQKKIKNKRNYIFILFVIFRTTFDTNINRKVFLNVTFKTHYNLRTNFL